MYQEYIVPHSDSVYILFLSIDHLPPQDEPGSATLAQLHPYPISSTRLSPVHFDRPDPPSHSEVEDMVRHLRLLMKTYSTFIIPHRISQSII